MKQRPSVYIANAIVAIVVLLVTGIVKALNYFKFEL